MTRARTIEGIEENLRKAMGRSLRALRGELSQQEISDRSRVGTKRVARTQISRWEKGKAMPSAKNLSHALYGLRATVVELSHELLRQARELESIEAGHFPPTRVQSEIGESIGTPEGERHLYIVHSYPRDRVMMFEAGPPESFLRAFDGWVADED